jgi:hypothetical protein
MLFKSTTKKINSGILTIARIFHALFVLTLFVVLNNNVFP